MNNLIMLPKRRFKLLDRELGALPALAYQYYYGDWRLQPHHEASVALILHWENRPCLPNIWRCIATLAGFRHSLMRTQYSTEDLEALYLLFAQELGTVVELGTDNKAIK